MKNPVPTALSEILTPAWLTEALSVRYPNIKVVAVTETWRLETSATKVRFTLEYGGEVPPDAPRSLCLKGFFGPGAKVYLDTGAAKGEAHFFSELAHTIDIRTPECAYAAIDEASGHAVLLLEDLVADGANFLTPLSPYTRDEAASSLDQLARLNASHWNGRDFERYPWLRSYLNQFAKAPLLSDQTLQSLSEGRTHIPLPEHVKNGARINRSLGALSEYIRNKPRCLQHGDAHLGNFYQTRGGTGLLDWQLLQPGYWALDVGYHIGASLSVADRERSERDLLAHYLDCLGRYDVAAPSWEEAWLDYRVGVVYGYYMWAVTQRVAQEVTDEFVLRLGSAVAAHDSFRLLGL